MGPCKNEVEDNHMPSSALNLATDEMAMISRLASMFPTTLQVEVPLTPLQVATLDSMLALYPRAIPMGHLDSLILQRLRSKIDGFYGVETTEITPGPSVPPAPAGMPQL